MRWRFVTGILGIFTLAIALTMLVPAAVALGYDDGAAPAFLLCVSVFSILGFLAWFPTRSMHEEINIREALFIVAGAWFLAGIIGAAPFVATGVVDNVHDAFFESVSGFTTTGSTIFADIEALPRSILFWRAFSHWIGGMGIIVLSVAILPLVGVGGLQLFRAEAKTPETKVRPRVAETARTLWLVYVGLTAVETVLLMFGGMDWFDATCHAFATLSTGGFSTRNASVGAYDSSYIHIVITVFMLLGGMNFALHYAILARRFRKAIKDEELRVYFGIFAVATLAVAIALFFSGTSTIGIALRDAAFQVTTILTCTGFATADFELWPAAAVVVLFVLMFVGGSTGSTAGGIKVMRHLMMVKMIYNEMFFLLHPHALRPPKYGGTAIPGGILRSIWSYAFLYLLVTFGATIVMGILGLDIVSALTSVLASMGNIGPGFGTVGATDNFGHIPAFGKWVLCLCMLLGRLEIYTVLVLFSPEFWKR
ncbi:TrkH family potassium uptake protein [bacterium]|nr:TrkH family potassium uptake protein [bacterium]